MTTHRFAPGPRARPCRAPAAVAGALLLACLIVKSASADPDCAEIHDVYITFEFTPKELSIKQGDCVHWENVHAIEHSAVGERREFNSGILMPGGNAIKKFDEVMELPYMCGVHPPMKAMLIIEPADDERGDM